MTSPLQDFFVRLAHDPLQMSAAVAGALLLGAAVWFVFFRKRPTPEELEAKRRGHLAATGRIIDGSVVDTAPLEGEPTTILYQYRVSGVVYERGQDVSRLRGYLNHLRIDMPVQVRYDAHNPADSIVVAETWNGLWQGGMRRRG
jgi:hypothetical protein